MTVDPESRETDMEQIGVHVQDTDGVCLSLQTGNHWHWLSHDCIDELLALLTALPQYEPLRKLAYELRVNRRGF